MVSVVILTLLMCADVKIECTPFICTYLDKLWLMNATHAPQNFTSQLMFYSYVGTEGRTVQEDVLMPVIR
jgi:hypothetical protein